jgi:hypothetical protein
MTIGEWQAKKKERRVQSWTYPVYITLTAINEAIARQTLDNALIIAQLQTGPNTHEGEIIERADSMSWSIGRAIPGEWEPKKERSIEKRHAESLAKVQVDTPKTT